MVTGTPRSRLERVRELLSSGDDAALVCAALELRQLIEVLTYRKLAVYSKYIPDSVMSTWQPPQALKALLQFEPDADQDFSISIAPEGSRDEADRAWIGLGHHKALKAKWLTKNYNKLGSYLHAPHGDQVAPDPTKMRESLEAIALELETVVDASITGASLAGRVSLDCMECGQPMQATVEYLEENHHMICFNSDCGVVHTAELVDGEWMFSPQVQDAECASCGCEFHFMTKYLKPGAVIACPECGARHQIVLGWNLLDGQEDGAS